MIIFLDGFSEYGPGSVMIAQGGYEMTEGATVVPGGGRVGADAAVIQAVYNHSGLRYRLSEQPLTAGFGYAASLSSLPSGSSGLALFQAIGRYASGSAMLDWSILTLTVLPTGGIQARIARSRDISGSRTGPVFDEVGPVLRPNTFHYVAGAFDFRELGVAYRVAVDGEIVLSGYAPYLTGVDPVPVKRPSALMPAGCMGFPKIDALTVSISVSDLALTMGEPEDAAPLADERLWTVFPDADGAEQDWTIFGASTAWEALSLVPPADGQRFAIAADPASRLSVGFAALPTNIGDISAVGVRSRLWSSSRSGPEVATQLRVGSTETSNDSHALQSRPTWYGNVSETNPATAGAWDIAAVNSAEAVLDRTA